MSDRPDLGPEPVLAFLSGPVDPADQELVLEPMVDAGRAGAPRSPASAHRPSSPATAGSAATAAPLAGPAPGVDVGRRTFFRRVAGELVHTAASLTGAATVAQGAAAGAAAAARELTGDHASGAATALRTASGGPTMEQLGRAHLSDGVAPWTWDGERLLLLDQRRLPATAAAFPVGSAGEAARAIAERVVSGPAAAIVAAWGLALTADAAAAHAEGSRLALITGAERSLLAADPGSFLLRRIVTELMAAIRSGVGPRATADRIESRVAAEHAALAERLAALLTDLAIGAPLVHGPSGVLWGGGAGTALAGVLLARSAASAQLLAPVLSVDPGVAPAPTRPAASARPVAVTEGRPWLDGARVTAWELGRRGVPAIVITDAAAPGAIARGEVDAVLAAAERVAVDGCVSLPVGAHGLALAAAHRGLPFIVAAPPWAIDATAADARALAEPDAPTAAVARFAGTAIAPPEAQVDATRFEVVPSALVAHLVTLS